LLLVSYQVGRRAGETTGLGFYSKGGILETVSLPNQLARAEAV